MQEHSIFRECRQGDVSSLPGLVDRHKTALYRYCLFLTRAADRADDLFQQTWVRAIEKLDSYDSKRSFATWLTVIATNLYRDAWRSPVLEQGDEPHADYRQIGPHIFSSP